MNLVRYCIISFSLAHTNHYLSSFLTPTGLIQLKRTLTYKPEVTPSLVKNKSSFLTISKLFLLKKLTSMKLETIQAINDICIADVGHGTILTIEYISRQSASTSGGLEEDECLVVSFAKHQQLKLASCKQYLQEHQNIRLILSVLLTLFHSFFSTKKIDQFDLYTIDNLV